LYQQQTAPTTFLAAVAAAANATHRLFVGAATAIKRAAFQEGSRERMQLAVTHLQTCTKQAPPPLPPRDARVEDLIDAYAAPGLPPGYEILARAIARWGYRRGYCYASQETLARWTGMSESTVQRLIVGMEQDGFLQRERRPGTSSIIILADGTLDALRLKKMRGITTRERTHPDVTRLFSMPEQENTDDIKVSARQKSGFGSQNTMCSQQSKSSTKSEYISPTVVSTTSSQTEAVSRVSKQVTKQANESLKAKSEKAPVKSSKNMKKNVTNNETNTHKKPVTNNIKAEQPAVQNDNEKQRETVAISQKAEHTTPQNGTEEKKNAVTPSISSHLQQTTAAALLIAEGVTPARARSFAATFEPEHIERNVALGLHRTKNNPPAYLLRLIQDDAASKRIVPGSEADQVRQRERFGALRGRIGPVKATGAREPVPSVVSPVQPKQRASEAICGTFPWVAESPGRVEDPLEALSPEDRDRYARRAREEVLRAKPWLGEVARTSNGPLMQAMIREQLRAMLTTTEAPASRGAPSG
jgi:hypothetical protein